MENTELIGVLEGMGLPEKASSIYVSLLGKSRMDVADIARATGIKRATCYEHLELLISKNFVTRVPIGKRTHYAANEPQKILADFKHRTAEFEKSVAEMAALHEKATNKPKVVFYEGKREMARIYDDLFKTVGDGYSIFPADTFFQSFSEAEYDAFDKTMGQHSFKSRDLFVKSKHLKRIKEIREKNGGEGKLSKTLPDSFKTNVDVLIYGDKVALMSLRDLSAVVIENNDIADLFKNMHAFMWKAL
jgi:sugar-specific transcriptional regulator TrmB